MINKNKKTKTPKTLKKVKNEKTKKTFNEKIKKTLHQNREKGTQKKRIPASNARRHTFVKKNPVFHKATCEETGKPPLVK